MTNKPEAPSVVGKWAGIILMIGGGLGLIASLLMSYWVGIGAGAVGFLLGIVTLIVIKWLVRD
jgi:hypothetical protein